ncbi:hypothetical protein N8D56_07770 [Devosia sp. A8/3-2]|nr:hypothetical protein N8D56_07770 [Devosia sp. A8/3-2]
MLKIVTGSIARRMSALLLLFVVGFAGLTAYQLTNIHSNLIDLKKAEIKSVIETAVTMLGNYDARAGRRDDARSSSDRSQGHAACHQLFRR